MLFNRCPSKDALGDFASKQTPAWIAKHILTCQKCRDELADLRRNEELLRELRGAFGADTEPLDGRSRARLMRRCLEVAEEGAAPDPPTKSFGAPPAH